MIAYFTRDSVCAGDDTEAPHARQLVLTGPVTIEGLVRALTTAAKLPGISGGMATWCVSSGIPLAVIAQQWAEPKLLHPIPPKLSELDLDGKTVRLHFSYLAQHDPTVAYELLRRLRVRASR